jgi:hypothetical protein
LQNPEKDDPPLNPETLVYEASRSDEVGEIADGVDLEQDHVEQLGW